jgi:dihydrofolate synthase/folylpolyglutamate synthase
MNRTGSFTKLDDWLPWLESLSPREIVLGLERVLVVLERLDLKRPDLVITVGGTNGKGSSVAMLEAILREDGRKTGCYTSPHVSRYNERIRIAGEPAGDAQIIDALSRVEALRGKVPLTYFEFGTLAALVAFDAAGVDTQVLEIGMGGRLDAVNAVESDGCLITNVTLDHCAWLGHDTESIAAEKAAIMRAGKPVVFGSTIVPQAITGQARKSGAHLILPDRDFTHEVVAGDNAGWSWRGRRIRLEHLRRPVLAGAIQLHNAAAVMALVEALDLDHLLQKEVVDRALGSLNLPGRFQVVEKRQKWILDVAHNIAAAQVLSASLAHYAENGAAIAVVGMLADKDIAGFVAQLRDDVDFWVAVSVDSKRGEQAATIARQIANGSDSPCLICPDIGEALKFATESTAANDVILVTGSFYTVGPALEWLMTAK